jgi:23S rRNA (cytidine1920-2'-O)/16S rRNA (cytidine1409-2'-O)-methyltransferase
MAKERLDKLVVQRGLAETRTKARALIMAGEVRVNGVRVDKSGTMINIAHEVTVDEQSPYVGRGGYKLAGALTEFEIDVQHAVCADVGACTGGFTDVLLQQGAKCVYAIDVGYGQLDWKLRQDSRVKVMERTNARYLETLPEQVDFVCIDVSFISLKLILPAVSGWLKAGAQIVALIKPQFEAGKAQVGKGGVIRDDAVRRMVLEDILTWADSQAWQICGLLPSSIQGSDGNVEYLVWLKRSSMNDSQSFKHLIDQLIVDEQATPTVETR